MAGTLVITTLSDGTNSTSSTNCIQGSAKAWVNFTGTGTVTINGSFNVSSITDNGTGDYTINFTTAMPNTTYSIQISAGDGTAQRIGSVLSTAISTGSVRVKTWYNIVASSDDAAYVSVAVFSS